MAIWHRRITRRQEQQDFFYYEHLLSRVLAQESQAIAAIRAGMSDWTTKTCISFKRRTNEAAYVEFVYGVG